ncbi:MAG: hypothetical protein KIS87_03460 [Phycisphaeraceae bacterium]|nr:hypothetical protein [Phycisphaeraceae bacterium]
MPRLVPVEIGEATHLNAIIEGKRAPARPRLRVLKPALETRYIEYAGTTTAFHSLAASTLVGTDAEYCVGCYNLDRPTVAALKRAVLDARPPNRNYLCQWCLIEPWGEMDHYVPKESFPEFAVMARNLAPCCSKCNKAKGDYWPPVGVVPEVLNLYYSSLLDRDHLSAAVTHAPGGASAIQFAIRRDVGLTPAEIATLEVHYARLRLMPRLQDAGISALSRFRHSLRAHGVTRANAVQYLVDEAVGLATAFGANHYEALTATALAAAPAALDDYLA